MSTGLDFDAALPQLPLIEDRQEVARLLAPELDLDDVEVQRRDTKYEPGVRCVSGFEIRGRDRASAVHGAVEMTPADVAAYPLTRDPRLPGLASALDPEAVAPRLDPLLTFDVAGVPWQTAPVRYKPGARCVIRYEMAAPEGVAVLFGKLVARGVVRQAEMISGLDQASRQVDSAPWVPPVVAVWPDIGVVLQPAVSPAVDLHSLAGDLSAGAISAFEDAGAAVAGLHQCRPHGLKSRFLGDDLDELREMAPTVTAADHDLGQRYAAVVDLIGKSVPESPAEVVTSHGALRTDQLLISGDRLVLIDLDTVCHAEPARDLANLLAYLDWKAIRHPQLICGLDAQRTAFLGGYSQRRSLPPARRLAIYRAASLVKIAGRRFRSLAVKEWPLVPVLIERAKELADDPAGEQT
jgi:hypothetical protein